MRLSPVRIFLACMLVSLLSSCTNTPDELVAKHGKRGDEYVQENKFKEAVIEYKNAVKAGPNNALLHWKLAKAALEIKDFRTAFSELQKTVELEPNHYEAMGKLGELYLASGKTEEATKIADNIVKSRPQDPQGFVLQAGISVRAGKVDDAIVKLKHAAGLDPKNVRSILTIGNLYMLKRDRNSARQWYDKGLSIAPDSVEVHIARGNFLFASGDRVEGEKSFRKAIELSKEKEDLRIILAEHFLFQGRGEESEKELNAVIKEMNSQKARKVLAEIKLESGKSDEAKPIVEAILKENEKDLDGKYLMGRIALAEKRFEAAKSLFGEVVKQDAGMARARLYNGLTDIMLGQIETGKKEVSEAVRLDPSNAKARMLLGELYLKSNAPEAAEKEALDVLRRNPSNVQAAILYADSFLLRKDWKKAEQVYQAIMKQLPKHPVGYVKMGYSRKLQRKPAEAAANFAQAIERNPKDLSVVNEYIFALGASKQEQKANRIMEEYLAKEPKNPLLWEMAGRYQIATGNRDEGEKSLLRAIELAPEFTQPYYELGVLYVAQRKLPDAEKRLRTVVEKNDKNVGAHTLLGVVLNSQNKVEEANKHYRRVLELAPKNPLAANNLASNLSDYGGNIDEALKFAQIAREAVPEDPNVSDTLGWIYYKKGLIDTALPLVEESVRKLSKNPVVRYHYGMVLSKKGKNREAAAELRAALALNDKFPGAEEAKKTLGSLK